MRICYQPEVYLVAKSMLDGDVLSFLRDQRLEWRPTNRLTDPDGSSPTDSEQLTELAGRVCYMSFGKKAGSKTNRAYIDNLLGRKADGSFSEGPAHGSVLEHATFSFLVIGAGRGFSHEQVRHRAGWAYSQLSTRYCDFERAEEQEGTWDPGFTIPPLGQLSSTTIELFEGSHRDALSKYRIILESIENDLREDEVFMEKLAVYPEKEQKRMLRKAARGAARDALPNGTEAIMVMSANARAIWNTIYLRASEHAEGEIRSVYVQIARIMQLEMPNVFRGLQFVELWDGSEAVIMPRDKL